ncbi:MAG TPA: MFS transporter [Chloroflexota bacterium]|nr:MFS transporter [Chloroflexota bacterium]
MNPLTLPSFIFAHFAHHVGTGGLAPLLPLIRDDFGLDYARSGLLLSAYGLALGFAQLPVSALADRMSKRLLIAIGLLGVGLLGILVAFTTAFWQLIPLLILIGVFGSTYHAPAAAYLAAAYAAVARGRALGTHVIGGALAFAAAPAIAAGVAKISGSWRMGFLALALFPIVSGVLMMVQLRFEPERAEAVRQTRDQVNALRALRSIGPLVAVALAEQLLTASMFAYIPLFLVDRHSVAPELAALSIGLVAGIGVLAAPLGGALSDRIGRAPVLIAVTASVGPLILLFTYAPVGWPIVAVLLLFGLSMNMRLPVLESLFADAIPAHRRSTVLGLYYFIGQESSGVTTPLVGRLIDVTDPVETFTILGVLGTAVSVVLLFTRQTLLAPRAAPAAS